MKLISINISEKQEIMIQSFVKLGYYPNRSEAIRNLLNIGIMIQLDVIKSNSHEKLQKETTYTFPRDDPMYKINKEIEEMKKLKGIKNE